MSPKQENRQPDQGHMRDSHATSSLKREESLILAALPAVFAAAKEGSFTRAARELGLTQSGLSRKISSLERLLGVSLFSRQGRAIELTADGRRIAEVAHGILNDLEGIRAEVGGQVVGRVRVGALPSIAGLLLAPNLHDFASKHSLARLSLTTIDADFSDGRKDPVTWDPSLFDVVITRGHGGWRGLTATRLANERMLPVCSPDFLRRHPFSKPHELADFPLLAHLTRENAWADYFDRLPRAHCVRLTEPSLAFEHFFMIIEAAKSGAGIALLPDLLIGSLVQRGELVAPLTAMPSNAIYSAVSTESALRRPAVKAFIKWLGAIFEQPAHEV